jgi:flagellar protein FliO/FliZ
MIFDFPHAIPKWNILYQPANITCSPRPVTDLPQSSQGRAMTAETPMLDSLTGLATAMAALLGIVGLILLIGRALRFTSFTRRPPSGRLLVVKDSIALDARRRLHLVQLGDRMVLLLTGGGSDVVVGWMDGPSSS